MSDNNSIDYGCPLYPHKGCSNCGRTCENWDGDWGQSCMDWIPTRGGHPSTPNPCENRGTFDLCWPEECLRCPEAKR